MSIETTDETKSLFKAWLVTRLMIAWIVTTFVLATTLVTFKWMTVTLKTPPPKLQVRTDTLRIYDTVTVITKAKDTVKVIEEHVGPLTEQRIAWLICGSRGQGQAYGDKRDLFQYNLYGMIFCPKDPPKE